MYALLQQRSNLTIKFGGSGERGGETPKNETAQERVYTYVAVSGGQGCGLETAIRGCGIWMDKKGRM